MPLGGKRPGPKVISRIRWQEGTWDAIPVTRSPGRHPTYHLRLSEHHSVLLKPSRRMRGHQTNMVAAREIRVATFNPKGKTQMSPQSGLVLVQEIEPRLRSAIPQCVHKVGAEDDEELLQDGLTMAAEMLHNLEIRGKQVTPGNVAYYCLLHLRSGRRSYSGGRTDVMGSGTQLDHSSMVLSFEEEVGFDPDLGEPITLGELLTTEADDPAMTAAQPDRRWSPSPAAMGAASPRSAA